MDNNQEKSLKSYFEQRRINPSNDAWSKLEATLSQNDKKKPKVSMLNLQLIAASFLILIGIALWQYFSNSNQDQIYSSPSNQTNDNINVSSTPAEVAEVKNDYKPTTKNSIENHTINLQTIDNKDIKSDVKKSYVSLSNPPYEAYASTEVAEQNEHLKSINQPVLPDKKVITSALVYVHPIDLLKDAESSISQNNPTKMYDKYDIDPELLLMEAEKDLKMSNLKKAYKSMKDFSSPMITAVMNRNEIKAE